MSEPLSPESLHTFLSGLHEPLPALPRARTPLQQRLTLVSLTAAFKAMNWRMVFCGPDGEPANRPAFLSDRSGQVLVGNHFCLWDAIAWDLFVTGKGRRGDMVVKATLAKDAMTSALMTGGDVVRLHREAGKSHLAIYESIERVRAGHVLWISKDGTTNLACKYVPGGIPAPNNIKTGAVEIAYATGTALVPVAAVGQQRIPFGTPIKGLPLSQLRGNTIFLGEGEPLHPNPAEREALGMSLTEYLQMYSQRAHEAIRAIEDRLYPAFLDTLDEETTSRLRAGREADPDRAASACDIASQREAELAAQVREMRPLRDEIVAIDAELEWGNGASVMARDLQLQRSALLAQIASVRDQLRADADAVTAAGRDILDAIRTGPNGVRLPPEIPQIFGGGAPDGPTSLLLHRCKRTPQHVDYILDERTSDS